MGIYPDAHKYVEFCLKIHQTKLNTFMYIGRVKKKKKKLAILPL